jgi:hypothetical protein
MISLIILYCKYSTRMTDEIKNNNSNNKKDNENAAKENEIEEKLENAPDKVVAESEKEASQLGDSDRE